MKHVSHGRSLRGSCRNMSMALTASFSTQPVRTRAYEARQPVARGPAVAAAPPARRALPAERSPAPAPCASAAGGGAQAGAADGGSEQPCALLIEVRSGALPLSRLLPLPPRKLAAERRAPSQRRRRSPAPRPPRKPRPPRPSAPARARPAPRRGAAAPRRRAERRRAAPRPATRALAQPRLDAPALAALAAAGGRRADRPFDGWPQVAPAPRNRIARGSAARARRRGPRGPRLPRPGARRRLSGAAWGCRPPRPFHPSSLAVLPFSSVSPSHSHPTPNNNSSNPRQAFNQAFQDLGLECASWTAPLVRGRRTARRARAHLTAAPGRGTGIHAYAAAPLAPLAPRAQACNLVLLITWRAVSLHQTVAAPLNGRRVHPPTPPPPPPHQFNDLMSHSDGTGEGLVTAYFG